MNQAKRLKVEDKEDFTSSSSDEESTGSAPVGEDNGVLNIEFEGLSLSDEDLDGIRQLLLQLFTDTEKTINLTDFANALIGQNFVGTVLKQVDAGEDGDDDIYALVTCFSLTRPKTDLTASIRQFFTDKCVPSEAPMADKKSFAKIFTESTEDRPSPSGALGFVISERFINVPPQAVKPMYEKLLEEIKEATGQDHAARFDFAYYMMITKICSGFQAVNDKLADEFYINAEEEMFAEEATVKFEYTIPGSNETSKRRVMLIPKEGFEKCVSKLKDEI